YSSTSLSHLSHAPTPTYICTLSLHDALPIWIGDSWPTAWADLVLTAPGTIFVGTAGFLLLEESATGLLPQLLEDQALSPNCALRSEEHTSELQSRFDLVCRLLLEKNK